VAMELRVKIYCLAVENAAPVFICKVNMPDTERYNALRVRLEEFGVVEWPLNFWDAEAMCRTKNKLEGMMIVDPVVYLIPTGGAVEVPRKCRCLESESVSSDVVEILEQPVSNPILGSNDLPDLIVDDA
jgi:hypothetical protein